MEAVIQVEYRPGIVSPPLTHQKAYRPCDVLRTQGFLDEFGVAVSLDRVC